MVMKGRGRGTSPLARRVDHPSRADEHRIDASEHSEQIADGERRHVHAHARQAWREAGDVADGGDRSSTLAKGAAALIKGITPGCVLGRFWAGDGLCVDWRCCVCWGLAWDGWRRRASKLTDGHLRGPGASHEAPNAGGEREAHTSAFSKEGRRPPVLL